MENLTLLLQFRLLLIHNQTCNSKGALGCIKYITNSFSAVDTRWCQTHRNIKLRLGDLCCWCAMVITLAGIRHAITDSFSTNKKASLLMRNNKVHGIISMSHGACQQGAEVEKTICQCVRASITLSPLIAGRGVMLHSWLAVYELPFLKIFMLRTPPHIGNFWKIAQINE